MSNAATQHPSTGTENRYTTYATALCAAARLELVRAALRRLQLRARSEER